MKKGRQEKPNDERFDDWSMLNRATRALEKKSALLKKSIGA